MTGYQVLLPRPWERVGLGSTMEAQVRDIVDRSVRRAGDGVPPDDLVKAKVRLEQMLLSELRAARDQGGIDYFLPTDLMHGVQINASFVVSAVVPDATADAEEAQQVMALLLSEEGATPVTIAEDVWVRRERILDRRPDEKIADRVRVRRVDYLAPVPGEERRWILVSFTSPGDGDLESRPSRLMTELFDAIMGTWAWVPAPERTEVAT